MKYKIITIEKYPARKVLAETGVSERQMSKLAGIDNATCSMAMRGKLILSKKTAFKIINAIKRIKSDKELREKLKRRKKAGRSIGTVWLSSEKILNRNKEIRELRNQGLILEKIGEKYNLTKERIRQICL